MAPGQLLKHLLLISVFLNWYLRLINVFSNCFFGTDFLICQFVFQSDFCVPKLIFVTDFCVSKLILVWSIDKCKWQRTEIYQLTFSTQSPQIPAKALPSTISLCILLFLPIRKVSNRNFVGGLKKTLQECETALTSRFWWS